MGASFRNVDQIRQLAGCDRLTISPGLLEELSQTENTIEQKLYASNTVSDDSRITLNENSFRWGHNEDAMATEKLAEGIRSFAADQVKLETLLKV